MSTANAFVAIGDFPFCATNIANAISVHDSYLDNIPLANAEALVWNLETFTLSTVGEITNGSETCNAAGVFTLNPIANSRVDKAKNYDGSVFYGDGMANETVYASWPAFRNPTQRLCNPSQNINGMLMSISGNDTAGHDGYLVEFALGTDPNNSGKYRLYYLFDFSFADPNTETIFIIISTEPGLVGYTQMSSGNVTIAGFDFPWYAYRSNSTNVNTTGGLSVSNVVSFTY